MRSLRMAMVAGASLLVLSAGAGAQLRAVVRGGVPAGYTPPAGMCRVWYDGVAPGRQPAPTDCATARANVRGGGRVIYGPTSRNGTYDPRQDDRDGRWDRDRRDRDEGRWDRSNDRRRHEMDKARRKREKEREKAWKKAHKHDRGDDRDDDDDDDDDDRGDRRDRRNHGIFGRGGNTGDTSGRPTWPQGGTGTTQPGRTQCVDANHDGVCDGSILGRVRVP